MFAGRVFGRGRSRKTTPEYWIDGRRRSESSALGEKARPSNNWGCLHEICDLQALDYGRWPQNERKPRGCILERVEGDRMRAAHEVVGVGRRNRCSAATR